MKIEQYLKQFDNITYKNLYNPSLYISLPVNLKSNIYEIDDLYGKTIDIDYIEFITKKELENFIRIYSNKSISNNVLFNNILYYLENNTYSKNDIIKGTALLNYIIKNINNYAEYDWCFYNKDNRGEFNVYRSYKKLMSDYSEDVLSESFLSIDTIKSLINFYKKDNLSFEEIQERIIFYAKNFTYYPDEYIKNLNILNLIKDINKFPEENIYYSNPRFSIYDNVKALYYSNSEEEVQKVFKTEEILIKEGYKNCESTGLIIEFKENSISILNHLDLKITDTLLAYVTLYEIINGEMASDEWVIALNKELNKDNSGKSLPNNLFNI